MNKIRTIIIHNNKKITNHISETIQKTNAVKLLGIVENEKEVYSQITTQKPDMVFFKYDFNKYNGENLIKKIYEKLKGDMPVFNIISDEKLNKEEIKDLLNIAGEKINSIILNDDEERYCQIIKDYIEYYNEK